MFLKSISYGFSISFIYVSCDCNSTVFEICLNLMVGGDERTRHL